MPRVEINKPIVDEIVERLKDATSLVLLDYRGLTVEEDTILRRTMREARCRYAIYKNTYLSFAVYDTVFESISPYLEGPSAIAIAYEDSEPLDRLIYDYVSKCPKLEVKCAVINGTYYEGADLLKKVRDDITKKSLVRELLSCLHTSLFSLQYILTQVLEQKCTESGIDYKELTNPAIPTASTSEVSEEPAEIAEENETVVKDEIFNEFDDFYLVEPFVPPTVTESENALKDDVSSPYEPPQEILDYQRSENKYKSILTEALSTKILPNDDVAQEHNTHTSWDKPKKHSNLSKVFWILFIVVVLGLMYLAAIYEIRTGF